MSPRRDSARQNKSELPYDTRRPRIETCKAMMDKGKIEELRKLLAGAKQVAVVSHTNPDGDAVGSALAWARMLEAEGIAVRVIVPNHYPAFLDWMSGIQQVHLYTTDPSGCNSYIDGADAIFCLDLNQIDRMDELGERIEANTRAKRVLIDHHPDPPNAYELMFSDISASSTSLIVWQLIETLGWEARVDYSVAEALYVGMCTDTGNFSYGHLTPDLYRILAKLVEKGIDPAKLNIAIYDNYSADRMRLMGYMLNEKMELIPEYHAACLTLDKDEQRKYRFQPGDSEGFVNLPLAIRNVSLSIFFLETRECIKVSLRSQGDIDVNEMARKHFNGGGHKNASGGKHFGPMWEAVEVFHNALKSDLKTG